MRTSTIAIVLTLLLTALSGQASALAESPMKMLRRTNKQLNALLRKQSAQRPKGTGDQIDGEIKRTINRFLDFGELARLALAKHWDARSPAERKEFTNILRELIERNYVKQLRSHIDYRIDYRGEKVEGDTAHVDTAVQVKGERRMEEVEIAYDMRKTKDGWMVFDVITDGVSIVRNYRSQFNRIIKKQSYDALVKKMRRKVETLKSST